MKNLTVQVVDPDSGDVLFTETVDVDLESQPGTTNIEMAIEAGESFTDPQIALHIAAPMVCPWDCDGCRS